MEPPPPKKEKELEIFTPLKDWSKRRQSTLSFTIKKQQQMARETPRNVQLTRDLRILPKTPGVDLPQEIWAEMHSIMNKKHIFVDVDDKTGNIALVATKAVNLKYGQGILIDIQRKQILQEIVKQYGGTKVTTKNQKAWRKLVKTHYSRYYDLFTGHVPSTFFNEFDWRSYFLWLRVTFLKLCSSLSKVQFGFFTTYSSPYVSILSERVERLIFSEQEIYHSDSIGYIQPYIEIIEDDMIRPPRINPNYTYKILRVRYGMELYSVYRKQVFLKKLKKGLTIRLNMNNYFEKSSKNLGFTLNPQYQYKIKNMPPIQHTTTTTTTTQPLDRTILSDVLFISTNPRQSPFGGVISRIFMASTIKKATNPLTRLFDKNFDYTQMMDKYSRRIKIKFMLSTKDSRLKNLSTKLSKAMGDISYFNPRKLANLGSSLAVGTFDVFIEPFSDPDRSGVKDGWSDVSFTIENFTIKWNVEKISLILLFIDLLKDRSKISKNNLVNENFQQTNEQLTLLTGAFLTKWREAFIPTKFKHKSEQGFRVQEKYLRELKNFTSQLPLARFREAHLELTQYVKKTQARVQNNHIAATSVRRDLSNLFNTTDDATENFYEEETEKVGDNNDDFPDISTLGGGGGGGGGEGITSNHECYKCKSNDINFYSPIEDNNNNNKIIYFCSKDCYNCTFNL